MLDSNVVSELMKERIDPAVARFSDRQLIEMLFLPSLVVAEIRYGMARMAAGRRRDAVEQGFETLLEKGFAARILFFDDECAKGYATARTMREKAGRPVEIQDLLIAGMALAYGASLATRNTGDFEGYGLSLINPWDEP
jgi:predicted nucleic acid-binding protein